MRVARRIASLFSAFALTLLLVAPAVPAAAVAGYNSAYFGESAFVNLTAGQSNQFAVGFTNAGSTGWVKGTTSQVNLAQCCPINSPSPNSSWAQNWLSTIAYATTTTDYVGPGQIGWFVYSVMAPSTAAAGNYRFDGDLVLGSTGEAINREGYFQIATIQAAAPPAGGGGGGGGGGTTAPPASTSSLTCLNSREVRVNFSQSTSTTGTTSFLDRNHYTLSAGLDIVGARSDGGSAIVTVGKGASGGHNNQALSRDASTYMANGGTYTLTVTNAATSGNQLAGTTTTTFTCNDSMTPTVSAPEQPGTYTMILTFSEPMDPTSTEPGIKWDSTLFSSIGNLKWQDLTSGPTNEGKGCARNNGCFRILRLDFDKSKASLPSSGSHTLEIRDAKDAAGNFISPNPTPFTVTIPTDSTQPTANSADVVVNGNTFYLDITYSESMAVTANGFSSTVSVDTTSNYVLRNPDGSAATTGGASSSGSTIIISSADVGGEVGIADRFKLKRVRLTLSPAGESPTLRPNTSYTVQISNVQDEAGNTIAPGIVKTFTWGGDSSGPQALRAFATSKQLLVDYNEQINSAAPAVSCNDPATVLTGLTNAGVASNYASPNSAFQTQLSSMTCSGAAGDAKGVIFNFSGTLQTGTYELDISSVKDPFGNLISPNPTIINVVVSDTAKPTLLGAGNTGTGTATTVNAMTIKFSKQMKGGSTDTNSAGNAANYSIDGQAFGSLCSTGSPSIAASAVAGDGTQTWTIDCGGGNKGQWAPTGVFSGTHTVTVQNVQDLSGNFIDPNPSTATFNN